MLRLIASPAPASLRPAVPLSSSCPCCADALRGLQDQYLFLRYHNGRKHGPVVACGYPCAGSCTGAVQLRRLSLRMRLAFATYRLRGRAWRQRDQSFVGGWFLRYCLGCFIRRLWLGSAGLCGLWHFSMGFGCSMAWFHARSLRPSRERRRVVRGVVCSEKRAAERLPLLRRRAVVSAASPPVYVGSAGGTPPAGVRRPGLPTLRAGGGPADRVYMGLSPALRIPKRFRKRASGDRPNGFPSKRSVG